MTCNVTFILRMHIHPGKEEPMKTPMGSFDNIFLRTGTLEL